MIPIGAAIQFALENFLFSTFEFAHDYSGQIIRWVHVNSNVLGIS